MASKSSNIIGLNFFSLIRTEKKKIHLNNYLMIRLLAVIATKILPTDLLLLP